MIDRLSERDIAVLRSVDDHRFLTTAHIQQLHFVTGSPNSAARLCRRTLTRLMDAGLLVPLQRRIGGIRAGSAAIVWQLGPVGSRVLRAKDDRRQRAHEPSERFMRHALAISDLHVALVIADRDRRLELLDVQLEPRCWRNYQDDLGETSVLKPDLSAVVGSGQFEDHWYIEIDLGNEHLPTIINKCRQYQAARHAAHNADVFPYVLWVLPTADRATKVHREIAAARSLDPSLFRTTTAAGATSLLAGGSS